MPGYASKFGTLGEGPVSDIFVPDTVQRFTLGTVQEGVDPYFGYGKFMYAQFPVSQAVGVGRVMALVNQTFVMIDVPNTANLGTRLYFARQACASSAVAQYGWFQVEGVTIAQANATVAAAAAIGVAAAGVLGTNAAGKQVLNVRVLQSQLFTITKTVTTQSGSPIIQLSNIDGLFTGLAASGTGIAASTISTLDPSGRQLTLSANATATGSVTATFTWTGFTMLDVGGAFVQGAIT